jgi:hypothetical protein
MPVSIDISFLSFPAFKQKTVFLAALKAVGAIFTFTTRAVFTDFKPLHRHAPLHILRHNETKYLFAFLK